MNFENKIKIIDCFNSFTNYKKNRRVVECCVQKSLAKTSYLAKIIIYITVPTFVKTELSIKKCLFFKSKAFFEFKVLTQETYLKTQG